MAAEKSHGKDMTTGSPVKLIFSFAVPLLFGNILQQMYNLVDSFVVGRFAEDGMRSLAAVGTSMPVIFLITSLFLGIGQGATIIISQFFGANDKEGIKKAVDTIYIFLFVVSVPVTVTGILISKPLLIAMNVEGQTLAYAASYMKTIFLAVVFSFGYNLNSGILQGLGNSKISLMFLCVATVVNTLLDLLFVAVLGWGVTGVAVATLIAQAIAFIFGIYHINTNNYGFKIKLKGMKFDFSVLKSIIKLGLPGGLQNVFFSIGIIFLQRLINSYGDEFMAGFTSAQKIDGFAFLPIVSFAAAVATFVGQNIGAGKIDRVKQGVKAACMLSIATCILIALIILPFREKFIGIFNDDPEVIKYGSAYLIRMMPYISILAVHFILSNALRGAGQSIVPLITSFLGLWVARIPAAYIIAYYITPNNPENIYYSFVCGWIIGLIYVSIYYLGGKWKKAAGIYKKDAIDEDDPKLTEELPELSEASETKAVSK